MWTWYQSPGVMVGADGLRMPGYSGKDPHKNDPDSEHIPDQGPLPCGFYDMEAPVDTDKHGPYVLWLTPHPENQMFGRSAFGIHGDSIAHPGQASEGCICVPHGARVRMWESGDHLLRVLALEPQVAVAVDPGTEAE